jgi:hypothetical protein
MNPSERQLAMARIGRLIPRLSPLAIASAWLAISVSVPIGSEADDTPAATKPANWNAPPQSSGSASPGKPAERLREGTRLADVRGSFVSVGADSVTFSPVSSKDSYRVLENLALQRISQQLDENRGQRQWIVSGLITEFRGANYLLVTKAVVQLQDGDAPAR